MVLLNLQLVVDWMVLVKHGLKPSSAVLKCKNVLFVSYLIAMKDPEINCFCSLSLNLCSCIYSCLPLCLKVNVCDQT